MKKTRFLSLLLVLTVMLTALVFPASAAGTDPTMDITDPGTSEQTLTLYNLPEECYGFQVTLKLNRKLENVAFAFADSLPTPGSYYTYRENVPEEGSITLYLTTKTAFSAGELELGVISSTEDFEIEAVSDLELLIGSGSDVKTVSYKTVAIGKPAEDDPDDPDPDKPDPGPDNPDPDKPDPGPDNPDPDKPDPGPDNPDPDKPDPGPDNPDPDKPDPDKPNPNPNPDPDPVPVPVPHTYAVSVPNFANGHVTVSHTSAAAGTLVTATAHPNAGYRLNELTVTSSAGAKIAVTDKGSGVFTFVMPSAAVELHASFTLVVPFTDVKSGEWYYDAVGYVYARGLMTGTGENIFSPDMITSRGTIVTILYRMEGKPEAGPVSFEDVEAGKWYSDAVSWTAANGIVNGYSDERFGPDDTITREQMATILYRYAGYKGYDVTARADLSTFTDAGTISSYALEAMRWAVAEKLIQGIPNETGMALSPSGSAVRSQSAAILMRFCENIAG